MTELLLRRPGPLPFAGLAGFVALQYFGGHPESCFHTLLFAVLFWIVRVVALRPPNLRAAGLQALAFGGALARGHGAGGDHARAVPRAGRALGRLRRALVPGRVARAAPLPVRAVRPRLLGPPDAHADRVPVGDGGERLLRGRAHADARRSPRWWRARAGSAWRSRCWAWPALAMATGIQPLFDVLTQLPGFSTAHNSRLAVIFVFCFALLAGWGLDELTEDVVARRALARRRLRGAGGVTAGRDGGQGHARTGPLRRRAEGRLGVLGSAQLRPQGDQQGGDSLQPERGGAAGGAQGGRPAGVAARVAGGGRARVRADRPAGVGAGRRHGVRGAGADAARWRPVQGGDGLQPGHPGRPRRAAGDRRDPLSPVPAAGPLRRARRHQHGGAAAAAAAGRGDALRALRRARLRLPDRAPLRPLLEGERGRQAGCLYAFCPQTAGFSDKALRALGLLGVGHLLQDVRDDPLESRARGSPTTAPTPASTPTRTRCRGRSWSAGRP